MKDEVQRICHARDWVYNEQCGCKVTFLGSCLHHTTRFEACSEHDGYDDFDIRQKIVDAARKAYRLAELLQPPM